MDKKYLYQIIDLLASEYGWKIDYILNLPSDIIDSLVANIRDRQFSDQKIWTKLIGLGAACGFSGKLDTLDKVFSGESVSEKDKPVDEVAWKAQVKGLWLKMQLNNKKDISLEERKALDETFENKWKLDNNIEF